MFALRDVSQNLANLETATNFLKIKKLAVGSSWFADRAALHAVP